jgi:outer membrane lipoprotein SlyB
MSNTDRLKRALKTQPGKSAVVGGAVGAAVGLLTAAPLILCAAVGAVAGGYLGKRNADR